MQCRNLDPEFRLLIRLLSCIHIELFPHCTSCNNDTYLSEGLYIHTFCQTSCLLQIIIWWYKVVCMCVIWRDRWLSVDVHHPSRRRTSHSQELSPLFSSKVQCVSWNGQVLIHSRKCPGHNLLCPCTNNL